MINKMKKLFVLLLVAAVVSLGLAGCEHKSDAPPGEHPSSDHPTSEHPQ